MRACLAEQSSCSHSNSALVHLLTRCRITPDGLVRSGVSNFNVHDLMTLQSTAKLPIEVLEAHFGIGLMDFEVLEFAKANKIHVVGFASTSEAKSDLPTFHPVQRVAANHKITDVQVMYSYLNHYNITVISSCFHAEDPSRCAKYFALDIGIFGIKLTAAEVQALDQVTAGKRTCTDCFTDECQACALALQQHGCPLEGRVATEGFPVWGRSNMQGTRCLECAARPQNTAAIMACMWEYCWW